MPSQPSPWKIYREYVCPLYPRLLGCLIPHRALARFRFGEALWSVLPCSLTPQARSDTDCREPGPIPSHRRVRPGDVGYINEGAFHLLFSAGIPLGSRVPGTDVPLTFEPLDLGPIILGGVRPKGSLHTDTVRQIEADVGGSVAVAPCVQRYPGLAGNHCD